MNQNATEELVRAVPMIRPAPLVSVCCITYNHERYIKDAIEGFLMQEVSYPYEIIIHDDCSTDDTSPIVRDYQRRNRDVISTIIQTENQRSKGRRIFPITLDHARGKYVALCEGDDFWTDSHKLQRQVDFLESHPDCAICFHNVRVFWEDGSQPACEGCPEDQKEISTLEDLLRANFIPTCAVMFRRGLFAEYPEWFSELKIGDWPLHILNAQYGKIGYINQSMAAYRVHEGGLWTRASSVQRLRAILEVYGQVNRHFNRRYEQTIMAGVSKCLDQWAGSFAQQGVGGASIRQTGQSIAQVFEDPPAGLQLAHLKSKTLGKFYAQSAVVSYREGDLSRARQCLFQMLRYDLTWLRNRGISSIGVDLLFGSGIATRIRKIVRHMHWESA